MLGVNFIKEPTNHLTAVDVWVLLDMDVHLIVQKVAETNNHDMAND